MISSNFLNWGSMGALATNRKLGEDRRRSINKFPPLNSTDLGHHTNTHNLKKLETSPLMHRNEELSVSSGGAVSRLSLYPEPVNRIRREVHAPCRAIRFGFRVSSSRESIPEDSAGEMGSFMSRLDHYSNHYSKTKKEFVESLQKERNLKKEAIVPDVKNGASDDSCIEEVEVVEDGRRLPHHLPGLVGKGLERNSLPSSRKKGDLKVEDAFDSLYLIREQDDSELSVHKKLHQSANRRDNKLEKLQFQIEQNENCLASLRPRHPVKKPEEEDVLEAARHEAFKPLTREEEADVARAFSNSKRRKVLAAHEKSNIEITGEVMRCLLPGGWLNDEVINLYLELLKEREKREPKKFLKCHFFNTFFYKKLIGGISGYDYNSVRRWTSQRKLGYLLFDCAKIFVPIHRGNHWCLAVINKKDEKFQYLDSMGGADNRVLKNLASYFVDEVRDKNGVEIDVSLWKQERVGDLPYQENGFDCGVFMIKYADFYSRGLDLCFNQGNMSYFRRRTVKEMLLLRAE